MSDQVQEGNHNRKPHILLLATGGTIASRPSEDGLKPGYSIEELLGFTVSIRRHYDIVTKDILSLDSSNIQPEEWQLIAREIAKVVNDYDGVVITHGTDTMAYTSSVLSFMLQGLAIPVVLTGSQLPIDAALTDAVGNLETALAMAASGRKGVFLAFNGHIILGTRAVKVRTTDFNAFESINYPNIAYVNGRGLNIRDELIPEQAGDFQLLDRLDNRVFLLKLTPGLNPEIFPILAKMSYRAIVIEAFGVGGLHYLNRDLVSELEKLIQSGITVVVTSQCLYESSDFSRYEAGRKILDKGALPAFDMTSESCVTKLIWIMGQTESPEEVARIFRQNIAGEIQVASLDN